MPPLMRQVSPKRSASHGKAIRGCDANHCGASRGGRSPGTPLSSDYATPPVRCCPACEERIMSDARVTACIPYFQTRRYIRRAVESLLKQTYHNLTVVVVNDGDPEPPWRELADINDRRLVRVSLPYNFG